MRLALTLLAAALALRSSQSESRAAAYAPAATAAVDWTPNVTSGVGVPGGIPARSTIYTTLTTTGDTTNRYADIEAALLACPQGQTVLLGPGVFWINPNYAVLNATHLSGKTLRGSGSNPATGTVIEIANGATQFVFSGASTSNFVFAGEVTGSPVKGDTVLTVTNAASATAGYTAQIGFEDDPTMFYESNIFGFSRRQIVLITAVNTGAGTITIQPGLAMTPTRRVGGAALTVQWGAFGSAPANGFGFEDCVVDSNNQVDAAVSLSGATGSWLKNIRTNGIKRYGFFFDSNHQCELRDSWVSENDNADWVSSSHAGMSIGLMSSCLIENNVVLKNFPLIEMQGGSTCGNVFGYNFTLQKVNNVAASYHNHGSFSDLWEGNCGTGLFVDGYFGGAFDIVVYRNDLHGYVNDGNNIPGYPVFVARYSRRWEVVGNQLGRAGTTLNIKLAARTAFNEGTLGTSDQWNSDPDFDSLLTGTLTTRTSDTSGTVTADTTIGTLSLPPTWPGYVFFVGLRWGSAPYYQHRRDHTLSSYDVGALTVTFAGAGAGTAVLPAQGTAVTLNYAGSSGGYNREDLSVAGSMVRLGNYEFSSGTITPALGTTTLPDSLYRSSAPSWFSGYTWPPFDPASPVTSSPVVAPAKIPAQGRYLAEIGPGAPTHAPGPLRAGMRRR